MASSPYIWWILAIARPNGPPGALITGISGVGANRDRMCPICGLAVGYILRAPALDPPHLFEHFTHGIPEAIQISSWMIAEFSER